MFVHTFRYVQIFEQIFYRTRREEGEYFTYLTDEQRRYTKKYTKKMYVER